MGELQPAPVGDDGIDIQAILRGSRIPQPGYRAEIGGTPSGSPSTDTASTMTEHSFLTPETQC
ncbi:MULTISPECIES: hypothetical protein [Rhodococcus]|uniref:hypothetical protein n=1 Tax=Rhodococcus TaxID=1827 RepID=UPI0015F722D2|nr:MULTISPECIES: hypothetical protein [Rhodococcus]MBY6388787.1 hypothetical protein [Rhodococcus erythropolis]MDI9960595.1 hypothetical protein [Rhodococcus sp. IEGM 1237]MDI9966469.1 hypothetical protein [Rhodococcus sp. IEGM 1251]MDV8129002.1 hypothetical protein [Rhodococcus sp. IEGM 1304]